MKLEKGGQYAQKGLAVHFMTEPNEICSKLPRTKAGSGVECIMGSYSGMIRPTLILAALKWLKKNNVFFKNIQIDLDALIEFAVTSSSTTEPEPEFEELIESGTIPIDYEFPSFGDNISFQFD